MEPKHTHARITDWVRFRLSEKKNEESVEVNEMVGLKSEMMRGGHLIRFTREACTGQWVKQPVGNAIEMYQKNWEEENFRPIWLLLTKSMKLKSDEMVRIEKAK